MGESNSQQNSKSNMTLITQRHLISALGLDNAPDPPADKPSLDSRWDEIRAANARNTGRQSSWDALRQNHERDRVQKAEGESGSERAQEQARFDAMLEAEEEKSGYLTDCFGTFGELWEGRNPGVELAESTNTIVIPESARHLIAINV